MRFGASRWRKLYEVRRTARMSDRHRPSHHRAVQNTALLIHPEIGDNSVEQAAIIPHDEVADPPAVGVNELALRRMRQEFIQQCSPFGKWPPRYVRRVITEIERFDAGFGVGSDKRVIDKFLLIRDRKHLIVALGPSRAPTEGNAQFGQLTLHFGG